MCLTKETHLDGMLDQHLTSESIRRQRLSAERLHFVQRTPNRRQIRFTEQGKVGADELVPLIRYKQAERREITGKEWHDDSLHAKLLGHLAAMHCARASEGDEGGLARILPTFHGNLTDSSCHVRDGDSQQALSCGLKVCESERGTNAVYCTVREIGAEW
jgi:hypothetical protein